MTLFEKREDAPTDAQFLLPIEHLPAGEQRRLAPNIVADLELCEGVGGDDTVCPMYSCITSGDIGDTLSSATRRLHRRLAATYTDNADFLRESGEIVEKVGVHIAEWCPPNMVPDIYEDMIIDKDGNRNEAGILKFSNESRIYDLLKRNTADSLYSQWDEFKKGAGFLENYYYMEWDAFKYLNQSTPFLQLLYTMNMLSPILTLLSPLSVFITPFFILQFTGRFTGQAITWGTYWTIVRQMIKELAIVKLFYISPSKQSVRDILMTLVYAAIYIYTSYQNTIACINFHKKIAQVHEFINDVRHFLLISRDNFDWWLRTVPDLPTHRGFRERIEKYRAQIEVFYNNKLAAVPETWSLFDLKAVSAIGQTMTLFYEMRHDDTWHWTVKYCAEFATYAAFICHLGKMHNGGKLSRATIKSAADGADNVDPHTSAGSPHPLPSHQGLKAFGARIEDKVALVGAYYAPLIRAGGDCDKNAVVKNAADLTKNLIISGPNASGKTTYMKTVLLNLIFTQQFGVGCYGAGSVIKPFQHLHCYLNIPDTSGRDSLFQAEARRCKEILDIIKDGAAGDRHFIIFDELFSGTNPDEAVKSSTAFIKYLSKMDNVAFMLTTHYRAVCKKVRKVCENRQMIVKPRADGGLRYTYRVGEGISNVKGGEFVLKEMGYPDEILGVIDISEGTTSAPKCR
jgi:hypothetical protein